MFPSLYMTWTLILVLKPNLFKQSFFESEAELDAHVQTDLLTCDVNSTTFWFPYYIKRSPDNTDTIIDDPARRQREFARWQYERKVQQAGLFRRQLLFRPHTPRPSKCKGKVVVVRNKSISSMFVQQKHTKRKRPLSG